MPPSNYTTISLRPDVRDRVRELKRGQESYSELLGKMAEQYTPDQTPEAVNVRREM